MVAIISEHRYSTEELKPILGKAVVNYLQLPQFYQSKAREIERINKRLIQKAKAIIFRLETFYTGTRDAIEYALYLKKDIKVITPNQSYRLNTLEDWKTSYINSNTRRYIVEKHPVLELFEEKRNEYFAQVNAVKAQEKYSEATADITETKEEIERFVHTFAPLYKVDVNYSSFADICIAYKSLKYYYDNSIAYDLNFNEIYSVGNTSPEDTPFFNSLQFKTVPEYDYFEEESYGDETLLEDTIYKGGIHI